MATYFLTRPYPNQKTYTLELSPADAESLERDIITGQTRKIKTDIFPLKGCTLEAREVEPTTYRLADQVFNQKYADFFYTKVLARNHERAKEGKPWLYSKCIEWARGENGGTHDVAELEAFIEAEWDAAKEHNTPTPRNEYDLIDQLIENFYQTEEGQRYVIQHGVPLAGQRAKKSQKPE